MNNKLNFNFMKLLFMLKNIFYSSFGYSIHLLASLGSEGRFALNRLSDAIMQVDQVDRKFLQFEGGLSVTGKNNSFL